MHPGTEPAPFDRKAGPRYLAGWHELLDLLADHLMSGGGMRAWSLERWEDHRARYTTRSIGED